MATFCDPSPKLLNQPYCYRAVMCWFTAARGRAERNLFPADRLLDTGYCLDAPELLPAGSTAQGQEQTQLTNRPHTPIRPTYSTRGL